MVLVLLLEGEGFCLVYCSNYSPGVSLCELRAERDIVSNKGRESYFS